MLVLHTESDIIRGFTAVLLSVILDYVILFQQKGAAHTQKKNKFVTSNPEFPTHCQLWLLLGTDVGSVYHPQIVTLIVREGNAILISHQQLQGMNVLIQAFDTAIGTIPKYPF